MRVLHAPGILFGFALALCVLTTSPLRAAETNTAYIVASDAIFDNLAGLRAYFKDAGVPVAHVTPDQLAQLSGSGHYLVFGSPDEQGPLGDLIRANLTPKELKDAATMGKGVLAIKSINGQEALLFITAYSMPTFVKGHASEWKDIFEDWYYIAQSITNIIGY